VEQNRGMPTGFVGRFTANIPAFLGEYGGSYAGLMQELGFVDAIMGRADQIAFIRDIVGPGDDDQGFAQVSWTKYRLSVKAPKDRKDADNIAVVTVAGAIVDGEQQPDVAAGDYIAEQLREARERDDVKAVVLRIDSPGGSAFASEVIRDEVLELKKAGKPVIASMGSLAASGGYWVAAPADEIWAAPTTVTGSIGIFGYLPTFENTLAEIGVYTDGIGTTPLAPFTAAGIGPLPEEGETILQMIIEQGYDEFLTVVAEGRNMTKEAVDAVAQGRVWIGDAADDLGLVDKLGDIDAAIAAAAARAGLEDWDVVGMTEPKSPFEIFLEQLTGSAEEIGLVKSREPELFAGNIKGASPLRQMAKAVQDEAAFQASFNDPNAIYARCVVCDWR
jgi:protease-4